MTPSIQAAHAAASRGDWDACLAHADEALNTDPNDWEGLFMAGVALLKTNRLGVALQLFHMASQIEPENPAIWNNVGCALQERYPEEALKALQKAIKLDPSSTDAMSNLVNVTSQLGRHEEAIAWAEKCAKAGQMTTDAAYNASFAFLSLGRWQRGWEAYRAAVFAREGADRNYHADRTTPRWNPEKRPDARVVIHGEQGLGDEIMFASMVPDALATGADVILECSKRLEGLFKRSFPKARVYGTLHDDMASWPVREKPDCRLEAGGLGEYFAKEPIRRGAYLTASDELRVMWRAYLDHHDFDERSLRVGISWRAGLPAERKKRSVPFEQLAPILSAPGVQFVCLDYEPPTPEQIEAHGLYWPERACAKGKDTDELAALVSELDLVISVTQSVVDLAGALGKETWAMVPAAPPWRYSERAGRDQMWWYESVKTYRQQQGDATWGRVVARIAKDLRERLGVL